MHGGDGSSIASIIIDFIVVVQVGFHMFCNHRGHQKGPLERKVNVQDWALDINTVYLFAV